MGPLRVGIIDFYSEGLIDSVEELKELRRKYFESHFTEEEFNRLILKGVLISSLNV